MELIIGFVIVLAVLGLLDLAALRWGANSRSTRSDWHEIDIYDYKRPGVLQ